MRNASVVNFRVRWREITIESVSCHLCVLLVVRILCCCQIERDDFLIIQILGYLRRPARPLNMFPHRSSLVYRAEFVLVLTNLLSNALDSAGNQFWKTNLRPGSVLVLFSPILITNWKIFTKKSFSRTVFSRLVPSDTRKSGRLIFVWKYIG
jgi:hypothetical protein